MSGYLGQVVELVEIEIIWVQHPPAQDANASLKGGAEVRERDGGGR